MLSEAGFPGASGHGCGHLCAPSANEGGAGLAGGRPPFGEGNCPLCRLQKPGAFFAGLPCRAWPPALAGAGTEQVVSLVLAYPGEAAGFMRFTNI